MSFKKISDNSLALGFIFFLIAFIFRSINSMSRLDETYLDIIISKIIPLFLIVLYLKYSHKSIVETGIHKYQLIWNIFLGILVGVVQYTIFTTADFLSYIYLDDQPFLYTYPYELFDLTYLVAFIIINSFMEEMLFRGLMMRNFMIRLSSFKANLLQSLLFGVWHVVAYIKYFVYRDYNLIEATFNAIPHIIMATVFGFIMGYMFLKTSSLWGSFLCHSVWNLLGSLVEFGGVSAFGGLTLIIFELIFGVILFIISIFIVRFFSSQKNMPFLTPWDQSISDTLS